MAGSRISMRIFLAGLALLAAIAVAAEVLLRVLSPEPILARIKQQMEIRHVGYVPDPDLGALMEPSRTIQVETPDFTYTLRTDHAGFPNLEPWPERLDVAVLGNSLITGAGVGYDGQFTTLLQDRLGGRTVLNLGVHGGGTGHQLRAYRKFAAPLKPRLVIATLWLLWEIDNSRKFADWLDENPQPDFTEYRFSHATRNSDEERAEPGRLNGGHGLIHRFLQGSRLVRELYRWFQAIRHVREPIERVTLGGGEVMLLSARNEERLMGGWKRAGVGDLRKLFFAPLEELKTEVESAGGTLLVALFPSKEELYAGSALPELLKVVEVARVELAARGIASLDLYPLLAQHASPPPFYSIDMHLNATGHRLVAEALAQWASARNVFSPAADGRPFTGD